MPRKRKPLFPYNIKKRENVLKRYRLIEELIRLMYLFIGMMIGVLVSVIKYKDRKLLWVGTTILIIGICLLIAEEILRRRYNVEAPLSYINEFYTDEGE